MSADKKREVSESQNIGQLVKALAKAIEEFNLLPTTKMRRWAQLKELGKAKDAIDKLNSCSKNLANYKVLQQACIDLRKAMHKDSRLILSLLTRVRGRRPVCDNKISAIREALDNVLL
jgi:hypothetical protein